MIRSMAAECNGSRLILCNSKPFALRTSSLPLLTHTRIGRILRAKSICSVQVFRQVHTTEEAGLRTHEISNRDICIGSGKSSEQGELADTLSEERRRQLKEHQEREGQSTEGTSATGDGSLPVGDEVAARSKKKVALLVGYTGSAYQGLQINEGANSIEAELELAIHLAGGISTDNFGNLRKVSWSRAARTDKGVHAAAQVIVLKLNFVAGKEEQMVENINRYLPEDMCVLDIKRVPKGFDARERSTGRRYEYIMPTFCLAPKEHIKDVFVEALEWEKAKDAGKSSDVIQSSDKTITTPAGAQGSTAAGDTLSAFESSTGNDSKQRAVRSPSKEECSDEPDEQDGVDLSSVAVLQRVATRLEGYRVPASAVEALRETLAKFKGTKNYHNYTRSKAGKDSSCNRYITSFTASDPWEDGDMEWIRLTVDGQSFLLNQIRKMVAASVDRVRGHSSEKEFEESFFPHIKFNLGIAPSQGLYLERVLYTVHNRHMREQGSPERALEWEVGPIAEALKMFKAGKIHGFILAKERIDHSFVAWLDRTTRYPCPYQPLGATKVMKDQEGDDEA